MKTRLNIFRASATLAFSSALLLVACQKKDSGDKAAHATTPPAAAAESGEHQAGDMAAKSATDARKGAQDVMASVKNEADTMVAKAQQDAADQAEKAEKAMAKMKADAQAKLDEAAAARKMAEENAAKAKAKAEADAAKAKAEAEMAKMEADAEAAKADAEARTASMQAQTAGLLEKYSAELSTLKKGASALKAIVDQNAALLPEGVQTKYKELDALIPELSSLANSLKSYQGTDLSGIQSKLQSDFGSARKIYNDIRDMLPAQYSAMLPNL